MNQAIEKTYAGQLGGLVPARRLDSPFVRTLMRESNKPKPT